MGRGRALSGIFGEMLEQLLRRVPRTVEEPRGQLLHRVEAARRAEQEARAYAAEIRTWRGKKPAVATVAVDRRTGRSYRGHSNHGTPVHNDVRSVLPKETKEAWSVENCGEVQAASNARNAGSQLKDLVMVSIQRSEDTVRPPCFNCRRWLDG